MRGLGPRFIPIRRARERWSPGYKGIAGLMTLCLAGAASGRPHQQFAETCQGQEVVTATHAAPITRPFTARFSADLTAGVVCYNQCTAIDTFRFKPGQSGVIRLAEVSSPTQDRLTTFDLKTARLEDHQVLRVLGVITREARASCRPAAYRQPVLPGVTAAGGRR